MAIKIIDAHPLLGRRSLESFWIDPQSMSGTRSISGASQVLRSPSPFWRAKIAPLVVGKSQSAWRAYLSSLSGRGCAIRLGVHNIYERADIAARFGAPSFSDTGTPFSNGALFSSGAGFAYPAVSFVVATAADAYDDRVVVAVGGYTPAFTDGGYVGIDGSMHIVTGVSVADGLATLFIEPLLRRPVSIGAAVTMTPTLVMQLSDDMQGRFDRVARNPLHNSTIELVEIPGLS